MTLSIYSLALKRARQVQLVPSMKWGGQSLIGMHIKFEDNLEESAKCVLQVKEVLRGSPAHESGLSSN